MEWYLEFANFVKEGVIQDPNSPADIGRLLRFESSISTPTSTSPSYLVPSQATQPGKELSHGFKQYSFDEYISRMAPDQKGIYWLLAPNRDLALRSPYLEAFQKKNMEVLFLYNQGIDAWLMRNLQEYGKRKLINVEGADLAIPQKENKDIEPKAILELCDWMGQILKDRVESVKVSQRLATSPAVVVGHELAPLLKIYRSAMPNYTMAKPKLEINFEHPLIQKLNRARSAQPVLANLIVEQIYDNALLQADILENPRNMIPRLHNLLEKSLDQTLNSTPTSGSPSSSSSSPSDSPSSPSPASSS